MLGRMRLVLDTNILLAAAVRPGSASAWLVREWDRGELDLVMSEETLAEAEAVVGAAWVGQVAGKDRRDGLLRDLRDRAERIAAPRLTDLSLRDAGDRRLVEVAVAGRADLLVTADREVLALGGYGTLRIVRPSDAARLVAAARSGEP